MASERRLIARKIDRQGDRTLIYDDGGWYHVIAKPDASAGVVEGDEVVYTPYGANFGWFVRALTTRKQTDDE